MDILQIIRDKIENLSRKEDSAGIRAVVTHIEIAEKYLNRANIEQDDNLFTDVIYRTNQAFEGILKEAYAILTGMNVSNKRTYDIEQYLSENEVFKERVLDLFTNYRKSWRNKSVHDHHLFFTEQEAFLAIVNVSAFINILLDQIIQKIAYENEKLEVSKRKSKIKKTISDYQKLTLFSKLESLLFLFSEELQDGSEELLSLSEFELQGKLMGFLSSVETDMKIETNSKIKLGSQTLRPDLIVEDNRKKIIVELKRTPKRFSAYPENDAAIDQLFSYLLASGIKDGILYYPPIGKEDKTCKKAFQNETNNNKYQVIKIGPSELFPLKYESSMV